MHEALTGLLERAELAVAACRGVVDEDQLAGLAEVASEARARLLYPEEVMVAVLAGGTGSGKSSLFNALLGEEHAEVGSIRPVTSTPLAGVPSAHTMSLKGFLDELGVERRVEQSRLPGVCLIDLPDTDSVEADHRHTVESVMPRVDVMLWVVDPEKYRDAALHHGYLKPLAPYRTQMMVVLNQIDRLSKPALDEVLTDLKEALSEDGMAGVPVVPTSASPPAGPPEGLDSLRRALEVLSVDRPPLYGKLVTDLAELSSALGAAIGPPLGYRERSEQVIADASRAVVDGRVDSAVDLLLGFAESLAGEVSSPMSDRILAFGSSLPERVHELVSDLDPPEEERGWWRRRPTGGTGRSEQAFSGLSELMGPLQQIADARGRAIAAVAELAISARSVVARLQPVT